MVWRDVGRPGPTGFEREERAKQWNEAYEGEWRKVHMFGSQILSKPEVFFVCEDAYYHHSLEQPNLWKRLREAASDVYTVHPLEVESSLDYSKQLDYTRFHDIAIRRVLLRRGWEFEGSDLVQIRLNEPGAHELSEVFDPGKMPFHAPKKINRPSLEGWWDKDSVEDFYQSNKILQVKR